MSGRAVFAGWLLTAERWVDLFDLFDEVAAFGFGGCGPGGVEQYRGNTTGGGRGEDPADDSGEELRGHR